MIKISKETKGKKVWNWFQKGDNKVIDFSKMTAAEKAKMTYRSIQKRKAKKQKNIENEIRNYTIDNMFKWKQRNHSKTRKGIKTI